MRILSLVTLSLLSNRNIVNRLIESMDDIIESTSSVEGEPIASDDDVSIDAVLGSPSDNRISRSTTLFPNGYTIMQSLSQSKISAFSS